MEVARQAARGTHDHVGGGEHGLQHANHLRLLHRGRLLVAGADRADPIDFRAPVGLRRGDGVAILDPDTVSVDQQQQFVEHRPRIADERERAVLAGVDLGDVDRDEPDPVVLERGFRGGGEIAQTGSDHNHEVGVAGQDVGRARAGRTDAAERQRVRIGQRALAGLRLADGNAGRVDELPQRLRRVAVQHAAAGHDHRPRAAADQRRSVAQPFEIGARPGDGPDTRLEQRRGVVVCLRLHVLRQRQRHRAGLRRRGQHAHRFRQRRDDLFRPVDPIPVAGDRLEAVVHREVLRLARLELLQDRCGTAAGEDVAGQQQHRHPVNCRACRTRDHVGGTGTDRGCAGEGTKTVVHLRVGRGGVHHRLLVASQVVAQCGPVLLEGLADAGDVAVPEDSEHPTEERLLAAVTRRMLLRQEPDHRLGHGQTHAGGRHRAGSPRCAMKVATSSSVGMKLAQP